MKVGKGIGNATLVVVLGTLTGLALLAFNRLAAPPERQLPARGSGAPDYAALLASVSAGSLRADLERLAACGSRFAGSPGAEKAADFLAAELRGLGFEVSAQAVPVTVPVTQSCRLLDESGAEIPGVRLYPLLPNNFRTVTTPPGGISGTVRAAKLGLARELHGVAGEATIVLLPAGIAWNTMAGMGVGAVIYHQPADAPPASWRWAHQADASVDLPRFYLEGDAQRLEGRRVTIQARVDFTERTTRNLIACLPAAQPSGETLILSGYYDAYSYVPDLAPGASQACSATVLLECARRLAADRAMLRRNVVILLSGAHCQALAGVREFVAGMGTVNDRLSAAAEARARGEAARADAQLATETRAIILDAAYWQLTTDAAEEAFWRGRSPQLCRFFTDTVLRVFDTEHMAAYDALSAARVAWIREGMPVKDSSGAPHPLFQRYNAARVAEEVAQGRLTTPLLRMKVDAELRPRFTDARFLARLAAEADRRRLDAEARRDRAAGRLTVADLFPKTQNCLFLAVDLTADSGRLALVCGDQELAPRCIPADAEIATQFEHAGTGLDRAAGEARYRNTRDGDARFLNLLRASQTSGTPTVSGDWYGAPFYFDSSPALAAGWTALAITTAGGTRTNMATPADTFPVLFGDEMPAGTPPAATPAAGTPPEMPMANLEVTGRLLAAVVAQLARGGARLLPVNDQPDLYTVRGRIVSQVGNNLTPNQLMPGGIAHLYRANWMRGAQPAGVGQEFLATADWNGQFEFPVLWVRGLTDIWSKSITLDAAVMRPETGDITWMLSQTKSGFQAPYAVQQVSLPQLRDSLASAVVFRCTPVQLFPMPDPNTLQNYAGVSFMEVGGQSAPADQYVQSSGFAHVCFVPPESRLFFTFRKGSKEQPNLMEVRAFALDVEGPPDAAVFRPGGLPGKGYFVADTPSLVNIEFDVARSMVEVNTARVQLQRKYNMADRMVIEYNAKALALVQAATAEAAAGHVVEAKRLAATSIAYSANVHPVIRKNAADAIVGILFFLFLAIPFSIFLEKLLIAHPDLRYQLLGQGAIFILFFLALRAVHPAYELVRSSYMILLGFVTLALALFVGAFVSARFSRDIRALQRRLRQEIDTTDVSRAGATATAFLLGLNNLRKRPVRTALTMLTLVLVTFVIICFASVSTNVVDIEFAVGKAAYSGLLIRDRLLRDVSSAVAPLREIYGEAHSIAPRYWAGNFVPTVNKTPELARYVVTYRDGGQAREAVANAVLGVTPQEREITGLKASFDVLRGWFETETEAACFLPRSMADDLGVRADAVARGTAAVTVAGKEYAVLGIFDDLRVDALLDLDGKSLMPIDLLSWQTPAVLSADQQVATTSEAEIPEDVPRLPARKVLIMPCRSLPAGGERVASVAVRLQGLDYAGARALISTYLERTGEPVYYGLDGVAFYGGKFRMQSVAGLLDLLLPLLIAALTVLNTMRGSVYERRSELFVFNAVGLAPNHIRFLFLAEASVYAVVGVVGGYLLAQSSGTLLKLAGLGGGLTINYSSLSAVAVSVVIMLVVFVSSLFPARMAAQLAAPSETMTRRRQTATADVIELELPFTFNKRDRVGIIPYFVDWFENYGEGSAGDFFCSPPVCGVRTDPISGNPAPCLQTTTWMKPYDLGVSQEVEVLVRHDPASGDLVATVRMTRKSGDLTSWERCCHSFIGLLRKRFLTWRAVSEADRKLLLERGRRLLDPSGAAAPDPAPP